jgi:hypothetical protein
MANQWLRLWHDMPNDPKWRTISRVSGQRIGDVISIYIHLLVSASNATERGRTQSSNAEDIATALDLEHAQVVAVLDAMQGRVLEKDRLLGWAKRQPEREDGSAERSKAWREARKEAARTQSNASERIRPTDKDKEETREEEKETSSTPTQACPYEKIVQMYHEELPGLPRVVVDSDERKRKVKSFWTWALSSKKSDGTPRAANPQQALEWIRSYFIRASENDFLMGRTARSADHRNWKCDLEYLMTDRGRRQVIEKTMEAA